MVERSGRGVAGDGDGGAEPTERIGRLRVIDEEGVPEEGFPGEAAPQAPEDSGWSPQALVLGAVALLIIVGALLLILWGSFQL
jgi:hypothetical protein